ncbi:MAG: hypothetical protein H6704_02105 [Myxococcales bacterium]|nr:hypothetical protein [Myxococcales bacterium]
MTGRVRTLGGGAQPINGGTVKLFHCGAVARAAIEAGRLFEARHPSCD